MNLNNIINEMSLLKAILIGLAIGGGYYLIAFDDGSVKLSHLDKIKTQITQAKLQIKKANRKLSQLNEYKEMNRQMNGKVDKVSKYFSQNMSTSDFMRLLSSEAKASGTNIASIVEKPSANKASHFFENISVEVKLEGTYVQILLFLSNLTRLEKVITIEQLSMSAHTSKLSESSEKVLNFSGTFSAYKLVKVANR